MMKVLRKVRRSSLINDKTGTAVEVRASSTASENSSLSKNSGSRRSSIQRIIKRLSSSGKGPSCEELQRELNLLRLNSQNEVAKSWAEVERLEKEKVELFERCLELEKRLEEEGELKTDNEGELKTCDENYGNSHSNLFEMSFGSLESLKNKSSNNLAKVRNISSSNLFGFGKSHEDIENIHIERIALMEQSYTNTIHDLEQKLKGRDAAIASMEKTIELQQQTWMSIQEETKDQSYAKGSNKGTTEKDDQIKKLQKKIDLLKENLKDKDQSTRKNIADIKKRSEKKSNEIRTLTSIVSKQKEYIKRLKLELTSLKNEKNLKEKGVVEGSGLASEPDSINNTKT